MIMRLVRQAFKIKRLRAENKRLKEELEQKDIIIQYLNGCINKANKRSLDYLGKILTVRSCEDLDYPNSSLDDGQISIHDILEN